MFRRGGGCGAGCGVGGLGGCGWARVSLRGWTEDMGWGEGVGSGYGMGYGVGWGWVMHAEAKAIL